MGAPQGLRRFVIVTVLAVAAWPTGPSAQFLSFDRCQTDDEVAADQRVPYQDAALRFAALLMKQDAVGVHRGLSAEMKRNLSPEQTPAMLRSLAPMIQGVVEPRVAHSYLVTSSGSGADRTVMCSAAAHGSSPALGRSVFVAVTAASRQAHVIVEAANAEKTMSFALWLVPDAAGAWLVHGFHASQSAALGKTGADIRAMAQEQRQRGHFFNAAVLLVGASRLANRGKYLLPVLSQDIQKDFKALETPPELKGNPPFSWVIGSDTYRVVGAEPTTIGGKFALMIRREVPSVADTAVVEDESRRLIAGFARKHPELREVFDAIGVVALEVRGGRSVGTVEPLRK